jgi:outer membrane protein OmpA-like peptidoglycan-associated protein
MYGPQAVSEQALLIEVLNRLPSELTEVAPNLGKAGTRFLDQLANANNDANPDLLRLALTPNLKLYVVGHTDNVGGLAANLELSRRRAAAVVQALTTQYGVAAGRLQAYGAGPYAPVASNDSEDGRALNRRVDLVKQ